MLALGESKSVFKAPKSKRKAIDTRSHEGGK